MSRPAKTTVLRFRKGFGLLPSRTILTKRDKHLMGERRKMRAELRRLAGLN